MSREPESFVADTARQRLDIFLTGRLRGLSRGHIQKLIAAGSVRVDGELAEADRLLRPGQTVTVASLRPRWEDDLGGLSDWILHEDRDLLVLEKPAGLLMHPLGTSWLTSPEAALAEPQPNLAGLLLRGRPGIRCAGTPRCGIVHRLDRATSGVLLVAKTPAASEALIRSFKDRQVSKTYRAVVRGVWREKRSRVEAPVGRKPGHRKVFATPFGKQASTGFTVLGSCPSGALVEARPLTGRIHQIRVHLDLLGHPVMGDVEFDRPGPGAPVPPRLMLHAYKIEFAHPATGKPASFSARIPKDMRDFWASIRS
ncbi:MAG: RluA family pseudouridine synthase [Elusimicrobia bacterium]|nr:RluA family pseudouridine synthase [Elusimicrobiota bacterium]